MIINFGGIVHLSTVDWSGSASTVVFFRGCPLRCPHCQNKDLQKGESPAEISFQDGEIKVRDVRPPGLRSSQITLDSALHKAMSEKAPPFLSRLVLSGGEPMMQPDAARTLARSAKDLGLEVGLETCGFYPSALSELLGEKMIDKVFMDIKAALRDPAYERATGRAGVAPKVIECLRISLLSKIPLEVRITVFPEMPSHAEIEEIAGMLLDLLKEYPGHRLESIAIQQGQPKAGEFKPVPSDSLKVLAGPLEGVSEVSIKERPSMKWGPG
ncbi:MAG TPA: radical SAM protein [Methanotrichaceae archaeon]|nr:radical SAM protein [Methanotrichaceae archaeon]